MLFPELLLLDDPTPRDGPLNMAIDEALLGLEGKPILRFYRWAEPSVSFGYFGTFAEASEFAGNRKVVRRWTGGGIVPHGDDCTYSLILSRAVGERSDAREFYRETHAAISRALGRSGVRSILARTAVPKISESCFANPVVADVLEGAKKIAGAAQRRTRAGLLQQGSIQRSNLPVSFRESFADELSDGWTRFVLEEPLLHVARELAATKYATSAWTKRR